MQRTESGLQARPPNYFCLRAQAYVGDCGPESSRAFTAANPRGIPHFSDGAHRQTSHQQRRNLAQKPLVGDDSAEVESAESILCAILEAMVVIRGWPVGKGHGDGERAEPGMVRLSGERLGGLRLDGRPRARNGSSKRRGWPD